MQSDVNFPLVLCKPSSQIIQPKFNQCKRFVLHPHFSFIYLTISILGSSIIFGLSLKYTLRFVPSSIGHSYFCNQEKISREWLKNVIEFDIIPMLHEYWFDDKNKCQQEIENIKSCL